MERTINYKEVELLCVFEYYPAEKMEWNDGNGLGHPGSPAMIDDIHVYAGDVDITELLDHHKNKIEDAIWETLEP